MPRTRTLTTETSALRLVGFHPSPPLLAYVPRRMHSPFAFRLTFGLSAPANNRQVAWQLATRPFPGRLNQVFAGLLIHHSVYPDGEPQAVRRTIRHAPLPYSRRPAPPLLFHLAANGPIHEAFHRNGSARYQPEKCTSARVTDPGDIQSRLKDNGCGPFGKRTCIFRDIYLLLENKPTPGEECPYCAISSVSTSTASAK